MGDPCPNGKNNVIILKLAKHRPLNCKEVSTLSPQCKTLFVRVWISLIQNLTRSEESAKKRRRKKGARKEKKWFGTDALPAKQTHSTIFYFDEQVAAIHRAKGLGPYILFLFFDTVCD